MNPCDLAHIHQTKVSLRNHSCPSYRMAYLRDRVVSPFSARKSHDIVLGSEELVKIWYGNGVDCKPKRIMLLDSGADESFICRSIVEELGFETTWTPPTTFTAFNGQVFTVSERVQPKWQFHKGSRRHQEYPFFVVPEIPGNKDMVLGEIAMSCLGIGFRASGVLTAQEDYAGLF